MDRFINILILDADQTSNEGLKFILNAAGNNLIFCGNEKEALAILQKREVGILLINIDDKYLDGLAFLESLSKVKRARQTYKIAICEYTSGGARLIKGLQFGAVDYIAKPFNPNLVKAKIDVFKTLYFKDFRINQLLRNIFPKNVLTDLNTIGKFSPKRIEEGTVLFTDFIAFSKIAKNEKPLALIQKLEEYFNKFDEIVDRYQLEKIKTIGDAYMALAGVTESNVKPAVRACLAALEMRNYILNQAAFAKATGKPFWEIRIGIHSGPLVAGIIGNKKMSFDVWGDTVNIAARAEQNSENNSITITDTVTAHVIPYFNLTKRGEIQIKHGGKVDMHFLEEVKPEFSLFQEGKLPNSQLRTACQLPPMDFDHARRSVLNKLKSALPEDLVYHDIKHTLNVEKSADRIAQLEGIKGENLILLKTAVLFHDAGFIMTHRDNEEFAIQLMKKELPNYGYSEDQIKTIAKIIRATIKGTEPESLLEMIMCDADHDYLGRADYYVIADKLRKELKIQGVEMSDKEWIKFQLNFLENEHKYYTDTASNIRGKGKLKRISELKEKLSEF